MNRISRQIALFCMSILLSASLYAQKEDFQLTKNIDVFFNAFKELQNLYVDSLSYEKIMKSAIAGMTTDLDPYTEFVPDEEQDDFDFLTTGRYGGIGSLIQQDSLFVRIVAPYKGYPADVAGLTPGDRLVRIDGKALKGLNVGAVSNLLRGPVDTDVRIDAVKLRSGDTISFTVKRKSIRISSVAYYGLINNTGYIGLSGFTAGTAEDFRAALDSLRNTGNLKSLVIDLRNNGGGRLIDAVKILDLFIPAGIEVVKAKGRIADFDMSYTTTEKPIAPDLPLAVLVNRGSASASEIVAGTIQDLDRGVVIGSRTFGKGLVQTIRQLGYDAQMKITTAKYYIPSGRCVQAHNFSVRNADGSVAFIPDSLKKEFRTQNGRKVYDGGGIAPDVIVQETDYSPLAIGIANRNLFFEYSLIYYKNKKTIAPASKFTLTDAEYNDFCKFVLKHKFYYETASERVLKQLKATLTKEKYNNDVDEEIKILTEKLKHDKAKDLRIFKDEIKQLLEAEIANRYYYDDGRIEQGLRYDKHMAEAISIITDPLKYHNLLTTRKEPVANND